MLVLFRAQGLCDRRGGRSWLPSLIVLVVCGRKATLEKPFFAIQGKTRLQWFCNYAV